MPWRVARHVECRTVYYCQTARVFPKDVAGSGFADPDSLTAALFNFAPALSGPEIAAIENAVENFSKNEQLAVFIAYTLRYAMYT